MADHNISDYIPQISPAGDTHLLSLPEQVQIRQEVERILGSWLRWAWTMLSTIGIVVGAVTAYFGVQSQFQLSSIQMAAENHRKEMLAVATDLAKHKTLVDSKISDAEAALDKSNEKLIEMLDQLEAKKKALEETNKMMAALKLQGTEVAKQTTELRDQATATRELITKTQASTKKDLSVALENKTFQDAFRDAIDGAAKTMIAKDHETLSKLAVEIGKLNAIESDAKDFRSMKSQLENLLSQIRVHRVEGYSNVKWAIEFLEGVHIQKHLTVGGHVDSGNTMRAKIHSANIRRVRPH